MAALDTRTKNEICGSKMDGYKTIDAHNTRGGVPLAWSTSRFQEVTTQSTNYCLSVTLQNRHDDSTFTITGVYGPSTSTGRDEFYEELTQAKPSNNMPWLLCGDFNVTLQVEDRTDNTNEWRHTVTFANLIQDLGLLNLPLHGRRFTWSNEREQPHMARLDRFLVSKEWSFKFPNATQMALPNTSSDHCPLMYSARTDFSRSRLFRFENCLLKSEQFRQMVQQEWTAMDQATSPVHMHNKMTCLQKKIKEWAALKFSSITKQIQVCFDFFNWIDRIKELRAPTPLEKFINSLLKKRFTDLSVFEEELWRQRAKAKWEIQGDRNTKYFHAMASNRKRSNLISHIEYHGSQHTDQKTKAAAFFHYYCDLMGKESQQIPYIQWDNLYQQRQDLQELDQQITLQEITEAINQWTNNKSPGPDGFTGEFYKTFLDSLLPDLHALFNVVSQQQLSVAPLNTSYIVLLPKKDVPLTPQDFRPISLIHGIQKIYSKVLANRLRMRMHDLLNDSQTGFVRNRQITEGFVYAQQILHHSHKNKIPLALFKADIRKAFDTLSWEFLLQVLRQIGLPEKFVRSVQSGVLAGSSQIMINGLLGKKITLKRGVRQGDPLSPMLFIMAMDFLAKWMDKLVTTGAIRLPYAVMKPCLFYADDAIFFVKPESQQLQAIKIIFLAFEQISGLAINLHKSEILFSQVPLDQRQVLADIMGCKIGSFPFTYLGLPLSNRKLPKIAYLPLLQRMNARLACWAARHLSIAGRIVLLNAVLSSLPTYFMSVFKMPKWVIHDMDKIRKRFLWHGATQDTQKINLAQWQLVCSPKETGGLGILDLSIFNQALLLKWHWYWAKPEHRIWKPIYRCTFSTVTSAISKALLNTTLKQFFNISIIYTPGDGSNISFWDQNWGCGILKYEYPTLFTYASQTQISLQQAKVSNAALDMFRPGLSLLAQTELSQLQTQLSHTALSDHCQDTPNWRWGCHEVFTVRSAYNAIIKGPMVVTQLRKIWCLTIPPRMKVFDWLMRLNRILTIDNLIRRGWQIPNRCILCKADAETVHHIFNECTFAKAFYAQVALNTNIRAGSAILLVNPTEMITHQEIDKKTRAIVLISQFILWRERGARIFSESNKGVHELAEEVTDQLKYTQMPAFN